MNMLGNVRLCPVPQLRSHLYDLGGAAFLKLPAATNTWQLPDSKSFENCCVPWLQKFAEPSALDLPQKKRGRLCAIFALQISGRV